MKMPFGKYKGVDIAFINSAYLQWVNNQDWFIDKYEKECLAVEKELEEREFSHSHFYEDKIKVKEVK